MSAILLKLVIYGALIAAVYFGARRIYTDWRNRFRDLDTQTHERDLKERQRPDVIDLKRDQDGVFRPGDKKRKDGGESDAGGKS